MRGVLLSLALSCVLAVVAPTRSSAMVASHGAGMSAPTPAVLALQVPDKKIDITVGERGGAARRGFRYIDREMLRAAAEYLCTSSTDAQDPMPSLSSWWSRLSDAFASGGADCGYVPPTSDAVYEGELFEMERRLLLEIA